MLELQNLEQEQMDGHPNARTTAYDREGIVPLLESGRTGKVSTEAAEL